MSVSVSPQPSTNPFARIAGDLRSERRSAVPMPPGPTSFSLARTHAFLRDPLRILLGAYEDFGPVFSVRVLHAPVVFMLGPEANHYMTVSHAENFRWRDGGMRDLIPLLGDGLLTIDGAAHRTARRVMLPAFHRDRILEAGEVMLSETETALRELKAGERVDVYDWTRRLALRIAMRALFGFDPDHSDRGALAHEFEVGLGYYGREYFLQALRGPRTPWARMQLARRRIDEVIYAEIALRRAKTGGEERTDLLGLLLAGRDEAGNGLSDQQVRDQVMTLLFAGHDTTTSTVTFLLYELARHPHELTRVQEELDRVLGDAPAAPAQLFAGLPQLDAALDETLRLYPAAWVGPRAAVETYEFAGVPVPAGAMVNYSSWASHRLPEVFPDPEAFVPDRFTPEARAKLPKGAYVPFGGGSRMCIGMRFGQLEIKAIVSRLLQRYRLEQLPGRTMSVQTTPTLGPRGGLRMMVREL